MKVCFDVDIALRSSCTPSLTEYAFLGRVSHFLLYITASQTDTDWSIRFLVLAAEADMDIKGVLKVADG